MQRCDDETFSSASETLMSSSCAICRLLLLTAIRASAPGETSLAPCSSSSAPVPADRNDMCWLWEFSLPLVLSVWL